MKTINEGDPPHRCQPPATGLPAADFREYPDRPDSLASAEIDAADGMGMSVGRRLPRVEFPLVPPLIIDGIRLSTVIRIATATIGSTVVARTPGEVISDALSLFSWRRHAIAENLTRHTKCHGRFTVFRSFLWTMESAMCS